MLKIHNSIKFKKDLKKHFHNREVIKILDDIISKLVMNQPLDIKFKDHWLKGEWKYHRECHVKPDVLLIYRTDETTLYLERFGSHSELFD